MKNRFREWHTDPILWDKLKPIAREMRSKPTEAENRLWLRVRSHHLRGMKFRRQHNIERFIVDFYCKDGKLVVEVDGPIHQYQVEEDAIRQEFLESQKLKVLRFTNDVVLNDTDEVIKQILSFLP
jgi:very-short-patch-repair endonuclease